MSSCSNGKTHILISRQITDAPLRILCASHNIAAVEYFIKRSLRSEFGADDHDALLRMPWAFEELCDVPPHEWDAWVANKAPYTKKLHPTTIAALNEAKAIIRGDRAKTERDLPAWREELVKLRSFGPLPLDVARKHKLTVHGELAQPGAEAIVAPVEPATIANLSAQLELFAVS